MVPYVTVGVGAISQAFKITDTNTSETVKFKRRTNFAYRAGVGIGYEITPGVTLDVGYRYTGSTAKMKDDASGYKASIKGDHSVLAGFRFGF